MSDWDIAGMVREIAELTNERNNSRALANGWRDRAVAVEAELTAEIADWQKRTEDRAMQLDSALARLTEALIEIARLREGLKEIASFQGEDWQLDTNACAMREIARALLKAPIP